MWGGWISAAGSAGCSSSDALLSQQLPGPCSLGRVWCPSVGVLLAPGALSLGSPLPAVPGAARLLSCVTFVTER